MDGQPVRGSNSELERYPSLAGDPRNFRSRSANRRAAMITMGALVFLVIVVLAFG